MRIHQLITEKSVEFKSRVGVEPTNLYLGDEEITCLLQWAYENQYINTDPSEAKIHGDHRPEVCGMKVYVVNEKNHFEIL